MSDNDNEFDYLFDGIKEQNLLNAARLIKELSDKRVQSLESLHRHLTTLSATLLGILAVFGLGASESPLFRWAMFLGALSLFLCLLSGIYCMWQYYRVLCKLLNIQSENYRKYGKVLDVEVKFPKPYEFAATFCPAIFCIGLLFLLSGVFLRLNFFHP